MRVELPTEYTKYLGNILLLIVFLCLLTGCNAGGTPNIQTVLENLSRSYPALWKLATAFAYVSGFVLAFAAIYKLKMYGEARTMMATQGSVKTPLLYFLASTMLIASPAAFSLINTTLFQTAHPLAWSGNTGGLSWSYGSIRAVLGAVQLIGLFAFIRGWLFIARVGDQGSQPGMMGKAITHILGGALAINIVQVQQVLWNTFGL